MFFICVSALLFVVYGSLVKYIMKEKQVGLWDILLARALGCLVFSFMIATLSGKSLRIEPGKKKLVFFRSLAGTTTFILYVSSIKLIPVVLATVLEGTSPFWAIFIGWIMLGLKLSYLEWTALVISFFATVMIYLSARDQKEEDGIS